MNNKKKMVKPTNKYVTALDYAHNNSFVLPGAGSVVSYFLFIAVVGTPVGVANASISLVLLIINGIFKMLLKTIRREK